MTQEQETNTTGGEPRGQGAIVETVPEMISRLNQTEHRRMQAIIAAVRAETLEADWLKMNAAIGRAEEALYEAYKAGSRLPDQECLVLSIAELHAQIETLLLSLGATKDETNTA